MVLKVELRGQPAVRFENGVYSQEEVEAQTGMPGVQLATSARSSQVNIVSLDEAPSAPTGAKSNMFRIWRVTPGVSVDVRLGTRDNLTALVNLTKPRSKAALETAGKKVTFEHLKGRAPGKQSKVS